MKPEEMAHWHWTRAGRRLRQAVVDPLSHETYRRMIRETYPAQLPPEGSGWRDRFGSEVVAADEPACRVVVDEEPIPSECWCGSSVFTPVELHDHEARRALDIGMPALPVLRPLPSRDVERVQQFLGRPLRPVTVQAAEEMAEHARWLLERSARGASGG